MNETTLYNLPTLNFLAEPVKDSSPEDHFARGEAIVETLKTFNLNVELKDIHAGPTITRYDIVPAAGVRISKIQQLQDELAMALQAASVRVIAPVPGKGCVGVEVPNRVRETVTLREILESDEWIQSKADIPLALGKDANGKPLVVDLAKMPHLLVAGSTGSGKTVCINSIIASLLFKASPEDLKFVMIDPKIVEMKVFNDLPHMLQPVVTNPKQAPEVLNYLIKEMENRYKLFADIGVRNITSYKEHCAKIKKDVPEEDDEFELEVFVKYRAKKAKENALPHLPYIVCIIDELADLMMVASKEVESGITRLSQLARAAGIHLIIATQRPSVDVITGVIKSNLPTRLAFKAASRVDSRTILDGNGAEQLVGRGDMLFLPPDASGLRRSQGAFVSDEEIEGIVEFFKNNG